MIERAGAERLAMVVAACAERTAQLFTGLVGADPARADDVALVIRCLDLLWQRPSPTEWDDVLEALEQLPELTGDEESPGLLAYADDAAAAVYYAVRFRRDGDPAAVTSCANSALNSAEFISDLLDDGVDRYEMELRHQEADMEGPSELLRERAREASRARLAELLAAARDG